MSIVTDVAGDAVGISASTWLILGFCALLTGGAFYLHHHIVKDEDKRIVARTENHLNKIKGVQNEIINATPGGHAVAVGMRRGVF